MISTPAVALPAFDSVGFWIPFAVSLCCAHKLARDRVALTSMLVAGVLAYVEMTSPVLQGRFADEAGITGIHVTSVFGLLYVLFGGRNLVAAFAGAFASIIAGDVASTYAVLSVENATVGGFGWLDGLILIPSATAVYVGLWAWVERVSGRSMPRLSFKGRSMAVAAHI